MATLDNLFSFDALGANGNNGSGANPYNFGAQYADSQGNLFGTTHNGGENGTGTVYQLSPNGSGGYTQKTLFSFDPATGGGTNTTGIYPYAGLTADAAGNLYGATFQEGAVNTGTVFELVKGAGTNGGYAFQTLYSFGAPGPNQTGGGPSNSPIVDGQGNLYGTTQGGGAANNGTVYELVKNPNGTYTHQTLFEFPATGNLNTAGSNPVGGLTADAQGNLYGTAQAGGKNGTGVVYELVKDNNGYTQRTLFSFDANNNGNQTGAGPLSGLTADAQGNLYGTTNSGGMNNTGTVYALFKGADGGFSQRTLFSFGLAGANATGGGPASSPIVDAAGNLYGTTQGGGTNNNGTVYALIKGSNGTYSQQTLASFTSNSTALPPNPA